MANRGQNHLVSAGSHCEPHRQRHQDLHAHYLIHDDAAGAAPAAYTSASSPILTAAPRDASAVSSARDKSYPQHEHVSAGITLPAPTPRPTPNVGGGGFEFSFSTGFNSKSRGNPPPHTFSPQAAEAAAAAAAAGVNSPHHQHHQHHQQQQSPYAQQHHISSIYSSPARPPSLLPSLVHSQKRAEFGFGLNTSTSSRNVNSPLLPLPTNTATTTTTTTSTSAAAAAAIVASVLGSPTLSRSASAVAAAQSYNHHHHRHHHQHHHHHSPYHQYPSYQQHTQSSSPYYTTTTTTPYHHPYPTMPSSLPDAPSSSSTSTGGAPIPPPPGSPTDSQSGANGTGMGKSPPRARLTEQEKKNNHIASEQKRRNAIRDGFDRLTELIPGCEGQGRSEGMVLGRSIDYINEQIAERRQLVAKIEALGGTVPPELREP